MSTLIRLLAIAVVFCCGNGVIVWLRNSLKRARHKIVVDWRAKMAKLSKLVLLSIFLGAVSYLVVSTGYLHRSIILYVMGISTLAGSVGIAVFCVVRLVVLGKRRVKQSADATVDSVEVNEVADCKTIPEVLEAVSLYKQNTANSTTFVISVLDGVVHEVNKFVKRTKRANGVLTTRFGDGLSLERYATSVSGLEMYVISLVNSLLTRLYLFDEYEYERVVQEFKVAGNLIKAQKHESVLREYYDFAAGIKSKIGDVNLTLDRLILEISKLNESNLEEALGLLTDLDILIGETNKYKYK